MSNKNPLQNYSKKKLAIVTISTVVVVSGGVYKLVPLLKGMLKEPTPIPEPIPRPNPPLPVPKPKPDPILDPVKIGKACEAIILCKISEETYNALASKDDHYGEKKHLKVELDKILEDYKFWQKIGYAESIANCIESTVTCDCFDLYFQRYCSN